MADITVTIEGTVYRSWTSYSISRSIESLSNSFSITVTDEQDQKNNTNWALQTQKAITIKLGSKFLITGYIDEVSPSITKTSHSITFTGRGKTSDLVDCSSNMSARNFSFNKTNIKRLAEALCTPFGIKVVVQVGVDLSVNFKVNLNTSETAFELLDKKAKELSLLLTTNNKGNLVIGNRNRSRTNDNLVMGVNILEASSNYDYKNRFSVYKVVGQSSEGKDWGSNINVSADSEDPNINRFRPLYIQGSGELNTKRAQLRANWEANVRMAKSQSASIIVQDHTQGNGDLWEPNTLVQVLAPELYINPPVVLLITQVTYSLDEDGTKTILELKREDAFEADPSKIVKSQKKVGWG